MDFFFRYGSLPFASRPDSACPSAPDKVLKKYSISAQKAACPTLRISNSKAAFNRKDAKIAKFIRNFGGLGALGVKISSVCFLKYLFFVFKLQNRLWKCHPPSHTTVSPGK
jgi:hypothetical protein